MLASNVSPDHIDLLTSPRHRRFSRHEVNRMEELCILLNIPVYKHISKPEFLRAATNSSRGI